MSRASCQVLSSTSSLRLSCVGQTSLNLLSGSDTYPFCAIQNILTTHAQTDSMVGCSFHCSMRNMPRASYADLCPPLLYQNLSCLPRLGCPALVTGHIPPVHDPRADNGYSSIHSHHRPQML